MIWSIILAKRTTAKNPNKFNAERNEGANALLPTAVVGMRLLPVDPLYKD
jgi:hypothetical protein